MPVQPISTIVGQIVGANACSTPLSRISRNLTTGDCSRTQAETWSFRSVCSSVSAAMLVSSAFLRGLGETQDVLGDDVVLHFERAAVDRHRFAEEPLAHGGHFLFREVVAFPREP